MKKNPYIAKLDRICEKESEYYLHRIDLIAASNFLRPDISQLKHYKIQRSMEGLLGKRPYASTKYLDEIENIGVEAAKRLFNAEAANIQPHSGSQANQAVYAAFLKPGDKVLAMKFDAGGHLTHGCRINFSGMFYQFEYYGINSVTQLIDYEDMEKKAKYFHPKLILAGATSYPRTIDYQRTAHIAKSVNAIFMVDMSHPSGLIAAGLYPSPVPFADVVTSSTEKTLWGCHGAIILTRKEYEDRVNKAVHPGTQSSVPISRIVQISRVLLYAESEAFKSYIHKVLDNAKVLERAFSHIPGALVYGGTDSHFIIVDVLRAFGLTGRQAEKTLEDLHIFTNRQIIPWETKHVYETSGLRIGTPSATSLGYTRQDFESLAQVIIEALQYAANANVQRKLKTRVKDLINKRRRSDIVG